MKKFLIASLLFVASGICFAQEQVEMADELRSSGKIYVVVAVLTTILIGMIIFLVLIDRKVSKVEKEINKK